MMQSIAHNLDSVGLSGKTTANTITTEPMFGFCDEEPKQSRRNLIRTISDNKSQPDEIKSAPSEKTKTEEQFNKEIEIDALWRYEVGFSQVMQHLANSKKPVVGHNVKFDLCFLYH